MTSFALRPHRSLAYPFLAALYPLVWFVARDAGIQASTRPVTAVLPRTLALAAGAVVASYVVAVVATAALGVEPSVGPWWVQALFFPSNRVLAAVAAVTAGLVAYVAASQLVALPAVVETAASAVGVAVGWPLFVLYAGAIGVENALGGRPLPGLEFVAVGLGVALSVTWLFLASGWLLAAAGLARSPAASAR